MRSPLASMLHGAIPVAAIVSALTTIAATAGQTAAPDYAGFKEGIFLPFLNAGDGDMTSVPHLNLSFGGKKIRADLDSGSTGVVVAASMIPGFDQLPSLGQGRLTYTSSGRVMIGQWVTTPATIAGRDGSVLHTDPMPVLAVTEVKCLKQARDCTPSDDPRGIAMIGVGFARESDAQHQSTPDKNPFLHVAGTLPQRHGYILQRDGVHVGLTAANTKGTFDFVKLDRQKDLPDWGAVPACISLNEQTPPACGTILVDTGVSAMFMTVPPGQAGDQTGELAPGTEVAILVGPNEAQSKLYSFKVGDDSPVAPNGTHLRVSPDRVFVNTSFHLLNGFDVLYDFDGGYAGFRRR